MSNTYSDGNGVNCILLTTERFDTVDAYGGPSYAYVVYVGELDPNTPTSTPHKEVYIGTDTPQGPAQGSFLITQYNGSVYIMPKTQGLSCINFRYTADYKGGLVTIGSSQGVLSGGATFPVDEFLYYVFSYTTSELSIIPVSTSNPMNHGPLVNGERIQIPVQWRGLEASFDITVN